MPYDVNLDRDTSLNGAFPNGDSLLEPVASADHLFGDPDYYRRALGLSIPLAKQLHTSLIGLLKPSPEEKGSTFHYFQSLVRIYWLYVGEIARNLDQADNFLLALIRFGAVSPKILAPEQRALLGRIRWDNEKGSPFHYVDEWLRLVGAGDVPPLAIDEPLSKRGTEVTQAELNQKLSKVSGQLEITQRMIQDKQKNRSLIEANLRESASVLSQHEMHPDFYTLEATYSDRQKRLFSQITSDVKKLLNLNREIVLLFLDLKRQSKEIDLTQDRYKIASSGGERVFNGSQAQREVESIARIARQTVGLRGNQLPILLHNYFPPHEHLVGFRERAIECVAEVERLDPEVFHRSYKGNISRVVPHFILIPSYGEYGICWEPFERGNKATGKGRIALPLFGRDIRVAVMRGLGDFRWEMAKEMGSFRWMKEGLTGWYYEWFYKNVKKGSIKFSFMDHYTIWLLKESKGIQKLPKELRDIFWRYTPFSDVLKSELAEKSFVYKDLVQKDLSRQSSQGY